MICGCASRQAPTSFTMVWEADFILITFCSKTPGCSDLMESWMEIRAYGWLQILKCIHLSWSLNNLVAFSYYIHTCQSSASPFSPSQLRSGMITFLSCHMRQWPLIPSKVHLLWNVCQRAGAGEIWFLALTTVGFEYCMDTNSALSCSSHSWQGILSRIDGSQRGFWQLLISQGSDRYVNSSHQTLAWKRASLINSSVQLYWL